MRLSPSARVGVALDWVFYLLLRQRDHCSKSFEADVAFAREILNA